MRAQAAKKNSHQPKRAQPENSNSESDQQKNTATQSGSQPAPKTDSKPDSPAPLADNVRSLFDGKSLELWEPTNFGGAGECRVEDGLMLIEMGDPLSGLTYADDDLPKVNYEFSMEAKRLDGEDFFASVTFPYKDNHCSLIVGGWAGSTVGLSNIDDKDASSNETKKLMSFEDNRWYKIRIRCDEDKIRCWIDDQQVVDLLTKDRKISLRGDTVDTLPLTIYTFISSAVYRNITIRTLKEDQ